jgi:polyisoprenyl-teichoic acid--peptidoglycan teichoic acid transferase
MPPARRRPRPRRTWPQRLFLLFNLFVIVAALASAGVLAYAKDTVSSIPRVAFAGDVLATEDADRNEPINFLLVGTDSIINLDDDDPLRNTRTEANLLTDTLIVLRVEPGSGDAALMSIPRDLWIPDLGYKINSAYALGEEDLLVSTLQNFLDIPIHRYIQVDFNGFLELMRVLGGIRVQIDYPLRDEKAQFAVNETGCVRLTPRQALGYVRSRTLTAETSPGNWELVDQTSDFGRIQRQQDFLVLALQRAFDQGMRNPNTLRGLIEDVGAGGYVQLDTRTTPQDILDLGRDFENFRAESLERFTLPVEVGNVGQASVVFLVEAEAQRVLNVFRGEEADNISFRIAVRNGTGESGLAQDVQLALNLEGFNVTETGNADSFAYETTVIRHDPSQRRQAELLVRWLAAEPVLEEIEAGVDAPVEIVVGSDWAGVRSEPLPPPTPGPDATPTADPSTLTPTPTPTPTPEPLAQIRGC